MDICVLGAGVIGVTTAYRLLQDGHRVTLVDAQPDPGSGASFGNGAQLSYSYVAPLAEPSVWRKWPHYLFSSESPLTLRPSTDSSQWRWLLGFLASCTSQRARQSTVHLLRLAFLSRDEMAGLRAREPIDFFHRVAGKLVMYSDAAAFAAARHQVEFQARYGSRQQILSVAECAAVEPALAGAAHNWVGGVYTPDEEVGDCALFCRALFARMRQHADFRFVCAQVAGANVGSGRLHAVRTDRGEIVADAFVLALGAHSAAFARSAGFSLPVYPLKGYSITLRVPEGMQRAPAVSLTDLARKIVYARLGDRLRIAGRVELVGMDASLRQRAVDELKHAAAALFPECVAAQGDGSLSPWAGLRPATPTGLPIIGAAPLKNLYLNTGHGSLGWTLACGSAALLADQIGGRLPPIDCAPFRHAAYRETGVNA